jgi:predicted DCC family thiol-disulfide oxidoreductase YuxK
MTAPHTILYDGDCPLCTFQSRIITWLDWFSAVNVVPLGDPRAAGIAPGLTKEALNAAIHCITAGGRIHRGARAIRFVSMRLPLALPVGLFLWLPGVIYIAEIIYRWVSRNRLLLSRLFGCKGACAILPAKK